MAEKRKYGIKNYLVTLRLEEPDALEELISSLI